MEPIVRKRNVRRSSYVDDITSTYAVEDINITYEKLKKDYQELLSYGEAEGSPFNLKKMEV